MSITVYVDMRSQPCRSLLIFLKNSDIPFNVEYIDVSKGEQRKAEYSSLFPLHTVPAIKDGDYLLAETVAIFRYLTTKYKGKFEEHWYPTDLQARGRVDEYLSFHHTGIRATCLAIHMSEVLYQLFGLEKTPEERFKYEQEKLTNGLDKIEKGFLKDNDFLCGSKISFADVMAVSEFIQLTINGRDVTEGRPRLKAFVGRVRARLNPTFDEVHAQLYAWRDAYQKK